MRVFIFTTLLAAVAAASTVAQNAPVAAPVHGVLVRTLHLGGDSTQATMISLSSGGYRLEIEPVTANIQLSRRNGGSTRPMPLVARPAANDHRVAGVFPPESGEYLVQLINPGVGATTVRVVREGAENGAEAPLTAALPAAASLPEMTVYDETFPGPYGIVLLQEQTAYRVEITGDPGAVTIRHGSRAGAPPMVLQPLSDPTASQGGTALLLIPTSSDEYRIEANGGGLSRVRIIRDPKETAYWFRVGLATRNQPKAGITVRGAFIGPFPDYVSYSGTPTSSMAAGFDLCFGLVSRGGWINGSVGGCALQLGMYHRAAGSIFTIGVAPRLALSPATSPTQLSLGASAGIATSSGGVGQGEESYWMFGLSMVVERKVIDHLWFEGEAGPSMLMLMGESSGDEKAMPIRASLGLQYRF